MLRRLLAACTDCRTVGALLAAVATMAAGGDELGKRFDHLFAAHDYGTLAAELKKNMELPQTAVGALGWEQRHVAVGSSVFVGAMYAIDLLSTAPGSENPAYDRKIRENAVTTALYTMAAIETDGTKCADAAAPKARRQQFVQLLTPVWIELRKLPDEAVEQSLARALSEEKAIAAARAPDDYLCRGRSGDIPDLFASGISEESPHFLATPVWSRQAAAIRAKLPELLAEFAVRVKSGS
jgi:hypothetical protein